MRAWLSQIDDHGSSSPFSQSLTSPYVRYGVAIAAMRRLVVALLAGGATTAAAEDVSNGEQLAQMQQQMAQILRRVEVLETENKNMKLRMGRSTVREALAQATSTKSAVSPRGDTSGSVGGTAL